ncbi:hypothetical protein R3P38DRAFT_3380028 [Favolaschia claudopus]|uniref:Uncharacterized protein n=1 Tax=Favolaschia claudopus TaxID=2862362 RepID=A0AAV9Z346_9AGAR
MHLHSSFCKFCQLPFASTSPSVLPERGFDASDVKPAPTATFLVEWHRRSFDCAACFPPIFVQQCAPNAVKEYVQKVWLLSRQISGCADQVKEPEKDIDLLMVKERQRRIKQSMREAETNGMNSTGRARRAYDADSPFTRTNNNDSMV